MSEFHTTIELGGEVRKLRYDMNALAAMEDKLGISISQLNDVSLASIRTLRTVLWAGLIHESPDLTETEVGSWVSMDRFSGVVDKIAEALEQAFGAMEVEDPGPFVGTGTRSESTPTAQPTSSLTSSVG